MQYYTPSMSSNGSFCTYDLDTRPTKILTLYITVFHPLRSFLTITGTHRPLSSPLRNPGNRPINSTSFHLLN